MQIIYSMFFLLPALLFGPITQPLKAAEVEGRVQKPGPSLLKSEWDNLIEAAKKEGKVVIYCDMPPTVRDVTTAAFRTKYGINLEMVSSRSPEMLAKIIAERNAGLYVVDMGFHGGVTYNVDLLPLGILEPLEPLLILPEVRDPKNWRPGKLPFFDKGKMAFITVMQANNFYQRNTDLVRENEITYTLDLLNPKWKEKIVINDPGISGTGNHWFTWTVTRVLGMEKGMRFMKDLVAQKPFITRDKRLLTEWVARGKSSISVASYMAETAEFIKLGAPIAFLDIKEPRMLTPASGIVSVFKNAPHRNAAKLFLNWLLTREGSSIFAPAYQYPSLRSDVPTEGVLPILLPRQGDIYPEWTDENYSAVAGQMRKTAADIFAPLIK